MGHFVDLGGLRWVTCILLIFHGRELRIQQSILKSWAKKLKLRVLSFDKEKLRVSLGLKTNSK